MREEWNVLLLCDKVIFSSDLPVNSWQVTGRFVEYSRIGASTAVVWIYGVGENRLITTVC